MGINYQPKILHSSSDLNLPKPSEKDLTVLTVFSQDLKEMNLDFTGLIIWGQSLKLTKLLMVMLSF